MRRTRSDAAGYRRCTERRLCGGRLATGCSSSIQWNSEGAVRVQCGRQPPDADDLRSSIGLETLLTEIADCDVDHERLSIDPQAMIISDQDRRREQQLVARIGSTGQGVGAATAIENGEGLAALDPHGDLVDRLLGIIPAHRIDDVVLLDPADEAYSVGFNILSAKSDLEKNVLASDLVSVFERLSTSWGDQMGSVLQNAIMAFLESSEGGTLADLRRFLIEPEFRNRFLTTVGDPDIVYYWQKGFAQLTGNRSIGPVLTRLETFLSPKPIRYMVSQKVNRLDFAHIMDTGKIFLARLPQGQIGRENAFLLGSLLVAKFQQTAMARQAKSVATRKDFWLYLDEFQNFITPSMAEILTGARKYRLGLVLAHQELRQLQRDSEVASAVLANPGTRIAFRLGDDDARRLAEGFAHFEASDLQNLEKGQAICRIERSDWDFNLAVPLPEEPDPAQSATIRERVVTASRQKYGKPRAEVEAMLARSYAEMAKAPVGIEKPERSRLPTEPPAPVADATRTQPEPAAPVSGVCHGDDAIQEIVFPSGLT